MTSNRFLLTLKDVQITQTKHQGLFTWVNDHINDNYHLQRVNGN